MMIRVFASILLAAGFAGLHAVADNDNEAEGTSTRVRIVTSAGSITAELYADKAPETVANFLSYVDEGHYQGTIFHRVIPGFMIQGGGFDAEYEQKPTREPIANEATNGLSNDTGTLAMARRMPAHSATAQFFINTADNRNLNHQGQFNDRVWGYAVFGKVVDGMDVVRRIESTPTHGAGPFPSDVPVETISIERIERIESEASEAQEDTETSDQVAA